MYTNRENNTCLLSASLGIKDWTPEHFIANLSNSSVILEDSDSLSEIPLLNNAPLHNFTDRQLVRFRGMVQDMHDPEYYFQQYEVKNTQTETSEVRCGMYTDAARCSVIIRLNRYFLWPFGTSLYLCSTFMSIPD